MGPRLLWAASMRLPEVGQENHPEQPGSDENVTPAPLCPERGHPGPQPLWALPATRVSDDTKTQFDAKMVRLGSRWTWPGVRWRWRWSRMRAKSGPEPSRRDAVCPGKDRAWRPPPWWFSLLIAAEPASGADTGEDLRL